VKNIVKIIRLSKPLHHLLWTVFGLSLVAGVLQLAIPLLTQQMTQVVEQQITQGDADINRLYVLFGISFGVGILYVALNSVQQRIGDHFGGEIRRYLTEHFYDHIFRLPQKFFDTELSGKIVNQLNRGIVSVEQFMKTASNFIFPTYIQTIFTFIVLFYVSWPVATFLLILFPIYTYLSYLSSKKWGEEEKKKNIHEDNTRGRIQEVITNMKLVKGFTNQISEWNYISKELVTINDIYARQSRTFHLFDFLRNLSLQVILLLVNVVIFIQTFRGVYGIDELVLLLQLVLSMQRPLFVMSFILSQIQTTESGTKEFFEILELESEEEYEKESDKKDEVNSIEFKDVAFTYDDKKNVLEKLSFSIYKNEKIALVGHSGAGKSTIINLITKFYTPESGDILMDGDKYSDLTHNQVRANIGLVFQENELFSTTIRENVSYGRKSTDEEIKEALKNANAWGFVKNLEDGIDTEVGEKGVRLSGGQKQRIQIARAMLHDSPIVILDEATSNLDSKSEAQVQEALERLMKGKIVIIIAHRFSTIQNVDRILVLENGKLSDSGTPDELSQKDGVYKDLLTYQLEGDKKLLKQFELY
jgi:ATP-binding cassette subfamily B protein